MRTDKIQWHFTVARICILLCCFMYADTYFLPLKQVQAVLTEKSYKAWRSKRSSGFTFMFLSAEGKIVVPEALYVTANEGDKLLLQRSAITAVVHKVTIKKENNADTFRIGFIVAGMGKLLIVLVLAGLISYHIFYHAIRWKPGRRDLLLFLMAATVLIFLFYLDVSPL